MAKGAVDVCVMPPLACTAFRWPLAGTTHPANAPWLAPARHAGAGCRPRESGANGQGERTLTDCMAALAGVTKRNHIWLLATCMAARAHAARVGMLRTCRPQAPRHPRHVDKI